MIMKKIHLFIIALSSFASCSSEDPQEMVKFRFENLDLTNYNNASNVLTTPPSNVRLDSVVYYRYYQFDPNTGTSSYDQYSRSENTTYAPPPPDPTGRTSEHFTYHENGFVKQISLYINKDYRNVDLTNRGELEQVQNFEYDANKNLTQVSYFRFNGVDEILITSNFIYDDNNFLIQEDKNDGFVNKFNRNGEKLKIDEFYNYTIPNYTSEYNLDRFNNILKFNTIGNSYHHSDNFSYSKNIYHPFANLLPKNMYPHLFFGNHDGGFVHFASRNLNSYFQNIQINSHGFPEIIQSGSYDDGYRRKYYYSFN